MQAARRSKTENLSLRLDPKTKFMLEFMSRVRGQSLTAVVDQAIRDLADDTTISSEFGNGYRDQLNWKAFWDPSDGIRILNILGDKSYPTTSDEDELRQFTLDHWPFFYTNPEGNEPKRGIVDLLWPNIYKYLMIWKEGRASNYWCAGQEMASDLINARIDPPEWPPEREQNAKPSVSSNAGRRKRPILDDEIPF